MHVAVGIFGTLLTDGGETCEDTCFGALFKHGRLADIGDVVGRFEHTERTATATSIGSVAGRDERMHVPFGVNYTLGNSFAIEALNIFDVREIREEQWSSWTDGDRGRAFTERTAKASGQLLAFLEYDRHS